jgi:anti-sigma regulatory factor (Ser/Thr protein kinase)
MYAMVLADWEDVRRARECAGALARAVGVPEPEMVETAVMELGNNCLEHRDGEGVAVLRIGCSKGKVILQAENPCRRRPDWNTQKPEAVEGFRTGGYGMLLVTALASQLRATWRSGRVRVHAEFV